MKTKTNAFKLDSLDMVGVAGSIPVEPTTLFNNLAHFSTSKSTHFISHYFSFLHLTFRHICGGIAGVRLSARGAA